MNESDKKKVDAIIQRENVSERSPQENYEAIKWIEIDGVTVKGKKLEA